MHWLRSYLPWFSISSPVPDMCTAAALPYPELFGAEIKSLSASIVTNYSTSLSPLAPHVPVNGTVPEFCNVTIQYTHPGQNDNVNVQLWLPLRNWNGRFMGTGGGGYATELGFVWLPYAVSLGYSAVATDGGHPTSFTEPPLWALSSPGNINWVLVQNYAAVALDDAATIGKAITTAYYGSPPKYSYWNGCSAGGRQGLMMAQRYPLQYDGILAVAPAINLESFVVAEYWPQLVMNELGLYEMVLSTFSMLRSLGTYPAPCQFQAITAAATAACDELDGLADNIVSAPGLCDFDPHSVVGQAINCSDTGTVMEISSEAATIAQAAWTGPRSPDGKFRWYGLNKDASLAGLVGTNCTSAGACTGLPLQISVDWISLFVQKNPDFDVASISYRQYDTIFRQSVNQFASILGTNDPDLTDFRDAGGKMITWHGLADELLPPNGTYQYYQRVLDVDPNAADYFRFFPAPSVGHCVNGTGWFPNTSLQSLVDWVENGIVPDTLLGTTLPSSNGTVRQAPLCPYPLVTAYKGGDINLASSFQCQPSF